MRTRWRAGVLSALSVIAACGRSDQRAATPARTTPPPAGRVAAQPSRPTVAVAPGVDPIVLRVSRAGGRVRAYAYTVLDSALWRSIDPAPRIGRALAFDEGAGSLAVIDASGALRRIDLRTGHVGAPVGGKLAALTSADGAAVYGILSTGGVARLTRNDATPWTRQLPHPARNIAPQPDGSVLVVGDAPTGTIVWRLRPPDPRILDSVRLPRVDRVVRPQVGDRLYCIIGSAIEAVHTPDLALLPIVRFPHTIRAAVPTPSGDRLYVALDSTPSLRIVDRYRNRDRGGVDLPGLPADIRMDPFGRYLLVRAATGDSVWVIAVGSDRRIGTVRSGWTADLPFIGPDGTIALADAPDVVFVDADSLHRHRTVPGGARDFWIPIQWNGFRPRPPGLDEPVSFARILPDSSDSIQMAIRGSSVDSASRRGASDPATFPPSGHPAGDTAHVAPVAPGNGSPGFTVQLAAVLDQNHARAIASSVSADGTPPRVIATPRSGITVYRVVLGPYATRGQAEAAGEASHHQYWVYEGAP